ncbi:glycosyltransferase [Vibrio coralliilyticus]|uniref:glycosyltransferase n=1 Tax=Vibrio coralliilyticus TaxID=190893 RepID=UPI00148B6761|nr:glycosyltransferase [Vibrio coralliilyticus]NOH54514.1 glycosyltransferase [Vibrio coralliilyticus]
MSNILHIYRTCYPETQGGIEQVIRNLSKGHVERGDNIRVLAPADENKVIQFEGSQIVFYKRTFSIKSNCFSVSMLLNAKEHLDWADVVNFHYPWPSGDLLLPLVKKDKPVVVTYHSDIIRQRLLKSVYGLLEKYFLNRADALIVTSQNYLDSSTTLEPYKEKCRVIPLGVDLSAYDSIDMQVRVEMERKVGSGFFLFVGVLRYYKGLQYLLEAAKNNGCHVVIAGSGPEEKRLKDYAKENELTNVTFLGFVSEQEKNALLSLSKCFVFPSFVRSEAFGVSLIEALYHGKPIISCDISTGTSFVNKHLSTGYVIPPKDASALSEAMLDMQMDANYLEYCSNAKERALCLFSYQKMVQSYQELYHDILSKRRA